MNHASSAAPRRTRAARRQPLKTVHGNFPRRLYCTVTYLALELVILNVTLCMSMRSQSSICVTQGAACKMIFSNNYYPPYSASHNKLLKWFQLKPTLYRKFVILLGIRRMHPNGDLRRLSPLCALRWGEKEVLAEFHKVDDTNLWPHHLGAFIMDHLQPVKLILFQKKFTFSPSLLK